VAAAGAAAAVAVELGLEPRQCQFLREYILLLSVTEEYVVQALIPVVATEEIALSLELYL
jgi:hypothetical protein